MYVSYIKFISLDLVHLFEEGQQLILNSLSLKCILLPTFFNSHIVISRRLLYCHNSLHQWGGSGPEGTLDKRLLEAPV